MAATQTAVDDAERRDALRALLMRPLLPAGGSTAESFRLVRRHASWLSTWLQRWPGWTLVMQPDLARLRKTPSLRADATRGVIDKGQGNERTQFSRRRYTVLCLVLAALDTEQRQTTLQQVARKTELAVRTDDELDVLGFGFDLKVLNHRRDLVAVMRLLQHWDVLVRADGDDTQFLHADGDCLYRIDRPTLAGVLGSLRGASTIEDVEERVPGVDGHTSAAWVGEPPVDIDSGGSLRSTPGTPNSKAPSLQAMPLENLAYALNEIEVPESLETQNRALQHSLVRRLLDDPVMYYDELTPREYDYWNGQADRLLHELHRATGLEVERRAEGVALLDLEGGWSDVGLPEAGTRGHATLLLAEWLANQLRQRTAADLIVPHEAVMDHMTALAAEHAPHWRKNADTPEGTKQIADEAIEVLESLALLDVTRAGLRPRPAIGRFRVEAPGSS